MKIRFDEGAIERIEKSWWQEISIEKLLKSFKTKSDIFLLPTKTN